MPLGCGVLKDMDPQPEITWSQVAAFIRQHTHDVRNALNGLELETELLREVVTGEEATANVARVRKQLRGLAEQMRTLSAIFQDPQPVTAPIAARDLWLIWVEKNAALAEPLAIRWVEELGAEQLFVDAEMIALILRELLLNAAALSRGDLMTATARRRGDEVIFELLVTTKAAAEAGQWSEKFSSTRREGYGLNLAAVRRLVEANGATLTQRQVPEEGVTTTQIAFPVLGEASAAESGRDPAA